MVNFPEEENFMMWAVVTKWFCILWITNVGWNLVNADEALVNMSENLQCYVCNSHDKGCMSSNPAILAQFAQTCPKDSRGHQCLISVNRGSSYIEYDGVRDVALARKCLPGIQSTIARQLNTWIHGSSTDATYYGCVSDLCNGVIPTDQSLLDQFPDFKVAQGKSAAEEARKEAKKRAKEEADRKAKVDADRKSKEEADQKAKEDADQKAKENSNKGPLGNSVGGENSSGAAVTAYKAVGVIVSFAAVLIHHF